MVLLDSSETTESGPPAKIKREDRDVDGDWDEYQQYFSVEKAGKPLKKAHLIVDNVLSTIGVVAQQPGFSKELAAHLEMPGNFYCHGAVPRMNTPIYSNLSRRGRVADKSLQKVQKSLMMPFVALARIADQAVELGEVGKTIKTLAVHGMRAQGFAMTQLHQNRMTNVTENIGHGAANVLQKRVVQTQLMGEHFFVATDADLRTKVVEAAEGHSKFDKLARREYTASGSSKDSHKNYAHKQGFRGGHSSKRDGHSSDRKDSSRHYPAKEQGKRKNFQRGKYRK